MPPIDVEEVGLCRLSRRKAGIVTSEGEADHSSSVRTSIRTRGKKRAVPEESRPSPFPDHSPTNLARALSWLLPFPIRFVEVITLPLVQGGFRVGEKVIEDDLPFAGSGLPTAVHEDQFDRFTDIGFGGGREGG